MLQEIQTATDLFSDLTTSKKTETIIVIDQTQPNLVLGTEYVGIILLEPSHSGEARQSPRYLIAMKHTKVSQPKWQFSPGAWTMVKHQTSRESKIGHHNVPSNPVTHTSVQGNS